MKKLYFSLILLAAFVTSAFAQTDPKFDYYKEPGQYPTRDYLNQSFGEHIDPFSGRLQFHAVDLRLPGNGGFEIAIQRSYTSVDDFTTPDNSPYGVGWTLHFGRVLRNTAYAICDVNFANGGQMPVLELPDGSRQTLFRDDQYFPNTGRFISTQLYRAECLSAGTGLRVFAPDGTQYVMNQLGNAPFGQNAYYTTQIVDRNNNTANITYTSFGGVVLPTAIATTPEVRNITLNYTGSGSQTHLSSITDGTRTWNYTYTQIAGLWFLTQVSPPAGGSWQYAYKQSGNPGLYSIQSVTYPQGGTIMDTIASLSLAVLHPFKIRLSARSRCQQAAAHGLFLTHHRLASDPMTLRQSVLPTATLPISMLDLVR